MGNDNRDRHPFRRLRTARSRRNGATGSLGMPGKRGGDVEDPRGQRPVPYGPVMSRADGAAGGAVVGAAGGAILPRWFELAVLSCGAFTAGFSLAALVLSVLGAFDTVLVIAVGLNVGLLCVLGVLRLPDRERERRTSPSAITRDGRRADRRRWHDRNEHVGAQPAPPVQPRPRHLPDHRQVARRTRRPADRRRGGAVRRVRRREPGSVARLLPVRLPGRPLGDRRPATSVRPPVPEPHRHRRLDRRRSPRAVRACDHGRPRAAGAVRARQPVAAAVGGRRRDPRGRRVVASSVLQP